MHCTFHKSNSPSTHRKSRSYQSFYLEGDRLTGSRIKFTHEQKMIFGFAVKLGWKIHKQDKNVGENYYNKIGGEVSSF
jgi:hypothetical protein